MREANFKIGWFFMSFVPLIVSIAMQAVVGGIAMAIHGIFVTYRDMRVYGYSPGDEEFMEVYMQNMMANASTGIFAYHLVATAAFFLWYYLMCLKPYGAEMQVTKILTKPMIGWSIIIGIILTLFNTQAVKLVEYVAPEIIEQFFEMIEAAGFGTSILAILAAVVLAPIGEELLCRGIIQHYAQKACRYFWVANVIQALTFGIMHLNIVQGTYAFLIGLVLGWLRHRYKTLLVPIIVHFVINFSTSTWLGQLLAELPQNLTIDIGLFGLSVAATAGILYVIREETVDGQ